MNLHGWTIYPIRRYQRKKDGAESVYWGASKHIDGKHHNLYLGTVENTRTDGGLQRELSRRLRQKLTPNE